jgi:zeaxanthin glucosyltransferase
MRAEKRHFGVLSAAGIGHVQPLAALAQELSARGHRVTFFAKPKAEARIREVGLDFVPLGANNAKDQKRLAENHEGIWPQIASIRRDLARFTNDLDMLLDEGLEATERVGVNALVVDEFALTGSTIAQLLRVPYFVISTSVPHRFGWRSARRMADNRGAHPWLAQVRSGLLEQSAFRMRGPISRALDRRRQAAGLGPVRRIQREFPCLAHITQMPQCLDSRRVRLPRDFYYAGPFLQRATKANTGFPWEQLDGRPVLYASLGTTRNVQPGIFRVIAGACQALDVQLVIGLGNRLEPDALGRLPGGTVVAQYAPQPELLKRACAVITHGGANTVFEALREGKPMVVIPLAFDQPALAARLQRLGIAEVLPANCLSLRLVRQAVEKVLRESPYRDAAGKLQEQICGIHGAELAANIMERRLEEFALRQDAQKSAERPRKGTNPILQPSAESKPLR